MIGLLGDAIAKAMAWLTSRPAEESKPKVDVFAAAPDPGPPYLLVDLYAGDLSGKPNWPTLARLEDAIVGCSFIGAIIKATEGTNYSPSWFAANWDAVRKAGGERYGRTWFRGCYHFLRLTESGRAQADYYLQAVDRAGGWSAGDILPIVDVELGGETNPNRKASAQQIIDCTSAWAARVKEHTGRRVMLYGRGAMRDLSIKSRMGCDLVWNPSYTQTMRMSGLEAWALDDVALWQYCGDGVGDASVHKLPLMVPGLGKVDVSVFVDGARKPTLARFRERLL